MTILVIPGPSSTTLLTCTDRTAGPSCANRRRNEMLPVQTPEARERALAAAHEARAARAVLKARLKAGTVTLPDVLTEAATDGTIAKMKVSALLKSLPGVGDTGAKRAMERLGIADNRRISGLGSNQREALEREFAPAV